MKVVENLPKDGNLSTNHILNPNYLLFLKMTQQGK